PVVSPRLWLLMLYYRFHASRLLHNYKNHIDGCHQFIELIRCKALLAITPCIFRVLVDFYLQTIRAGHNRGLRHGRDDVSDSSSQGWIDDDKKAGLLLMYRDRIQLKRVSCCR